MRISVVFPVVGSDADYFLANSFAELGGNSQIQVICVDGTSSPKVRALCDAHGVLYLASASPFRADRLREGIAAARGDWIVLHHPRSFLDKAAVLDVVSLDAATPGWGAWTHSFDRDGLFYDFTSWYSNRIRGDLRSVFYLDHCLYLNRSMLNQLGAEFIPSVAIFEDTLICHALRAVSQPRRLHGKALTSGVRFATNGPVRQAALNQLMKLCFHVRLPDGLLNRIYEGNLQLNGETDS